MKNLFQAFYKGKTVLVTGHTGFKGSWLSIWLKEMGAAVIGYALEPYTDKDNFVLSNLHDKMTDIRGDIRDLEQLKSVFQTYRPQIVFHLAAQPLVRPSYDMPRETFEQNVMGTVNVLECVRNYDFTKECICITSDKCYGNQEWIWGYRENDPMGGHDPYSASKGCSELVIAAYIKSFFHPGKYDDHRKVVASVRAGNVIGGGDWAKDRIIPDCFRAIERGTAIEVRNPKAIRPWQHVLEPLSGYLFLGSHLARNPQLYSGAWNFGPDNDSLLTVAEVVGKLLTAAGTGSWIDKSDRSQPHEATLLNLDCSKSFHYLKWKPSLSIEKCIQYVAEWYTGYGKGNVYELCVNQLNNYIAEANKINNLWAERV
jgi:CDP-glucose 4,6-dehydratase